MNRIKIIIILISFPFFFFQCNSLKVSKIEKLCGAYIHKPEGSYLVAYGMVLNKDMTFKYTWIRGNYSGVENGNWKRVGEEVIFTNEKKNEEPIYEIIDLPEIRKEYYEITIIDDATDETLPFVAAVMMKDSIIIDGKYSDFDGKVKLYPTEEIEFLQFSFIGLYTVKLPLKDLQKSFILRMKEAIEPRRRFEEERWEIKEDHLYNPKLKRYYTKN